MRYTIHPAAELFPMIEGEEFDRLVSDIDANGQAEPITITKDAQILDGRNRFRACEILGRAPITRIYEGADPVGYVVSLNLHRRHLNESQRAMVAAKLANLPKGVRADRSIDPSTTQSEAAAMLNVSAPSIKRAQTVMREGAPELVAAVQQGKIAVSQAAQIASRPIEQQQEIVAKVEAGQKPVAAFHSAMQEEKREQLQAKAAALPVGEFPILYVDPPWRYEHVKTESRAIENQYPTMDLDEICALEVPASKDAILFIWATSPKLAECMRVIESWGFVYRTCAVWDKEKIGMGYYFRQQHELLLVAVKGNWPAPEVEARESSVYREARGQHSAKPAYYADLIERMYPGIPKIEMFCRSPREGWNVWGNEAA